MANQTPTPTRYTMRESYSNEWWVRDAEGRTVAICPHKKNAELVVAALNAVAPVSQPETTLCTHGQLAPEHCRVCSPSASVPVPSRSELEAAIQGFATGLYPTEARETLAGLLDRLYADPRKEQT